jgi:phosphopantetheine adenylyltransferase
MGLADGKVNGQKAFMTGALKVKGNVMLAVSSSGRDAQSAAVKERADALQTKLDSVLKVGSWHRTVADQVKREAELIFRGPRLSSRPTT